ncbi:hypothetical protein RCTITAN_43 [Rhodobacter phage RcTitan]|uniref:Uncharacterized protein n=1 Tax=Rhodobacter phage RcTitan TaxID=1662330 RepID=A0A0K1LLH6_9CAUD|nr:hypothetical protein RCTITAN_43 [Rhodobacter phage RcTitan]AKU43078.1 hypothetical protein RCTITAN_43 [Rhodobacter phage RcTitan]
MANVRPWQRKAPARSAGATPKPKAWANAPRLDSWAHNYDGSVIPRQHRCIEAPDAGVRRTLRADDPDAWPDMT